MTLYTDDDVQAALVAMFEAWYEPGEGWDRADAESGVRAILDAVAPAIAARALREAADAIRNAEGCRWESTCHLADSITLNERADEIEAAP